MQVYEVEVLWALNATAKCRDQAVFLPDALQWGGTCVPVLVEALCPRQNHGATNKTAIIFRCCATDPRALRTLFASSALGQSVKPFSLVDPNSGWLQSPANRLGNDFIHFCVSPFRWFSSSAPMSQYTWSMGNFGKRLTVTMTHSAWSFFWSQSLASPSLKTTTSLFWR